MNPRRSEFPHRPASGFTLLELVLVMTVLTIAMAVATPTLRGFWGAARSRDAVEQFVSITRWARAMAASDSRVYRLNVNATDGSYWLTVQDDGAAFVPVGNDFGQLFTVPPGARIDFDRTGSAAGAATAAGAIDFHPDGRCDVARVLMTDPAGNVTVIASPSPAEPFRALPDGEAARP